MSRWWRVWDSFWFVPAVCCVLALALSEIMIAIDRSVDASDLGVLGEVVNRVGEAGSRDLLGAIAASTLAVAATSFSITLAVLATASATYGPRLVRNFMADRGNQVVLGVLVATFLYALLVLRSIRSPGDAEEVFVPHLAVNLAVGLGVASIGVLVYFINHIADSVQVATLARAVRSDLWEAIDQPYPEGIGFAPPDESAPARDASEVAAEGASHGLSVTSEQVGYMQGVRGDRLMALAAERNLTVTLEVRLGDFLVEGSRIARVAPLQLADEQLIDAVRGCVVVGPARTPRQDVEFAVQVLVEMAVRALSPSMNDPFTAINALDELTAGLGRLAARRLPSPTRCDGDGLVRVIALCVNLDDLVDQVFDAMRIYAVDHPTVLHRTLDLAAQLGRVAGSEVVHARLRRHVSLVAEAFERSAPQDVDLARLRQHALAVEQTLRA
jgi:uncharacterized membrane protein